VCFILFRKKVIDEIVAFIAENNPGIKGFGRRGLYRMKQFFETYKQGAWIFDFFSSVSLLQLTKTLSKIPKMIAPFSTLCTLWAIVSDKTVEFLSFALHMP